MKKTCELCLKAGSSKRDCRTKNRADALFYDLTRKGQGNSEYAIKFRKKLYECIAEICSDLERWNPLLDSKNQTAIAKV